MEAAALAVVLISEIMYNPASSERLPNQTEWVELYNPGDKAVEISGWYLRDEDGHTAALPAGVFIEPGEAIVLIPAAQTPEDFQAAWGDGFDVYPLAGWDLRGIKHLANGPSDTNEVLRLCRTDDSVSDEVNYDDEGDWPSDKPAGSSIYLLPEKLDAEANDDGKNWRKSEAGAHEAHAAEATDDYSASDIGSPGKVARE